MINIFSRASCTFSRKMLKVRIKTHAAIFVEATVDLTYHSDQHACGMGHVTSPCGFSTVWFAMLSIGARLTGVYSSCKLMSNDLANRK